MLNQLGQAVPSAWPGSAAAEALLQQPPNLASGQLGQGYLNLPQLQQLQAARHFWPGAQPQSQSGLPLTPYQAPSNIAEDTPMSLHGTNDARSTLRRSVSVRWLYASSTPLPLAVQKQPQCAPDSSLRVAAGPQRAVTLSSRWVAATFHHLKEALFFAKVAKVAKVANDGAFG